MTNPARPMGPLHGDAGEQPYAESSDVHSASATCIYPGCPQPAVGAHPLGGPPSMFCANEQHHALSAHLERRRRAAQDDDPEETGRDR